MDLIPVRTEARGAEWALGNPEVRASSGWESDSILEIPESPDGLDYAPQPIAKSSQQWP